LGDPVRLSIVRQLCESGPLQTVQFKAGAGGVSRQGITKHLRVLEEAGLVESSRTGRNRQWQLQAGQISTLQEQLAQVSALWDERAKRLRAFVEDSDA
jgi:DNA-binding transcriptional ArsR family regulator